MMTMFHSYGTMMLLSIVPAFLFGGPGGCEYSGDESAGDADAQDDAAADGMASDTVDDGDGGEGDPVEAEAPEDAGGEEEGPAGYAVILFPADGDSAPNPVTFRFDAGGSVETVWFECEGWPLQDEPIPADRGTHTYRFAGVNFERNVVLTGLDSGENEVARDEINFTPTEPSCALADQDGFNLYTVRAVNDTATYPKDGTYPYCWSYYGDECGEHWGMVHDGYYAGQLIFPGGADCFCSGHTLEIFLRAYRLWQSDSGVGEETLFDVDGNILSVDDVDIGEFYQHWQGFGVASEASSANAFEHVGIGRNLYMEDWDNALPGDYVNLSRSTGTGHAVIFVGWIEEEGEKVGLRYYGCNGSGDSCPNPDDELNTAGNSGPSFKTELFEGHGGTVLPEWLFIGRVYMPGAG
ncbi:MAG: hypothetical protein ABIJ56_22335 [Pseudomonadota bacterium]